MNDEKIITNEGYLKERELAETPIFYDNPAGGTTTTRYGGRGNTRRRTPIIQEVIKYSVSAGTNTIPFTYIYDQAPLVLGIFKPGGQDKTFLLNLINRPGTTVTTARLTTAFGSNGTVLLRIYKLETT